MPDPVEPRDIELMRRLSAGDEDAFLEFYRRHQGGVYRFAVHMSGRPEAAADVVQETFLTLIRHAGKFDEEKGAPAAFLYGIARNQMEMGTMPWPRNMRRRFWMVLNAPRSSNY